MESDETLNIAKGETYKEAALVISDPSQLDKSIVYEFEITCVIPG